MKKIILLITLSMIFNSCAKDPKSKINPTRLGTITINESKNYTIQANSATLYRISFHLNDSNEVMDNNIAAIFSINSGKLIDPADITKEASTITVKINNRVAEVLYRPSSEALSKVELVVSVDPFRVIQEIDVEPVTPEIFEFEQNIYSTNKAATLDIVALLKSTKGKVSTGLDVEFLFKDIGQNSSIIRLSPNSAKTTLATEDPYTKVATKIDNLNQVSDTVLLFIRYQNINRDTATIYFHD